MAGIRHDAIDVVELYDSFTITVLLTLEALGFCKRGEGGAFVAGQRTAPGGDRSRSTPTAADCPTPTPACTASFC
jgi:acetyl-CoA acetyltransferase